jgi:hypothetical protein
MNKVVITGHTSGIGLNFYNYFKQQNYNIVGYNTVTGFDNIVNNSIGCDLFINNSYADGFQIDLLENLHNKVGKMIVCGSVAAFNPDPNLPEYSKHKKELADKVRNLNSPHILMLHLSSKSYNTPELLLKVINLWLEYPLITEIFFDPTGKPNE